MGTGLTRFERPVGQQRRDGRTAPVPEYRTAEELLERTDMKRHQKRHSVEPADLEAWLEREGLATIVGGRVVPTARARSLIDSLHVDGYDDRRRAG